MEKQFHRNRSRRRSRRGGRFDKKKPDPFENLPPLKDDQQTQLRQSFLSTEVIVFDIETTGGNPDKNGITEIAALHWRNGEIVNQFHSLVNPQMSIPPIVRKMTGINNAMLKDAPLIDEVMPQFVEFIGERILVSHNIIGDLKFLRYYAQKTMNHSMTNLILCTHLLSERVFKDSPNKSLTGLAHYLGIPVDKVHRAQEDADITLQLFRALLTEVSQSKMTTIEDLIRFQKDMESGLRLGWPFNSAAMASIPRQAGCVVLKDSNDDILFACAASQMPRLIGYLRKFPQLPRQVLRLVLRAKSISHQVSRNYFDALLLEAKHLTQHKNLMDPLLWRQRYINVLSVRKSDFGFAVKIEPLADQVDRAFGPAADISRYSRMIEDVARNFGQSYSPKGTVFSEEQIADLIAVARRDVDTAVKKTKFNWAKFWNFKAMSAHLKRKRDLQKLKKFQPAVSLGDVLAIDGYLCLQNSSNSRCVVYQIKHSIPIAEAEFEGVAATVIADLKKSDFDRKKQSVNHPQNIYSQRAVAWFVLQKGSLFKEHLS